MLQITFLITEKALGAIDGLRTGVFEKLILQQVLKALQKTGMGQGCTKM